MDQVALAQPITKYARAIRQPERTLQILDEAWAAATAAPPGPVHLTLPMDVQRTEVPAESIVPPARIHPVTGIESDLDAVVRALSRAQAPLVIAGSGVFYDREGDALLRFCEAASIPVVTPIWDRGSVDGQSPVWMGVIGAATGGPAILPDADCVILAGAVSDYRTNYLRTHAPVLPFRGQWDALGTRLGERTFDGWLAVCQERRDAFRASILAGAEAHARGGMHALHIVRALEQVLSEDPVLLIDGGSIGQWAHQLLCSHRYPGHWLTCGRSGVVGWGIGGAMAARLAFPKRPVILLSGDGSFTFTAADLEPAVRQSLPFVAIVADDQGWGITRDGHIRQFGEPISSSLGPIAFDRMAESLGARGVRATTPHQLALELRRALDTPTVTVIHAPILGGTPAAS
jgi:acetolactate synthase I/II/III large subunit